MQKVERKEHRNGKPRRWLWLAAAFVLLAGSVTAAVLLTRKDTDDYPTRAEDHSGMLIDRAAEDLVSVTVQRRGEEAWTMIRTEDGRLVPKDGGDWTAGEQQAELLQQAMTMLPYREVLAEDASAYREMEAFGFTEPLVTVTANYTDGTSATVYIGNDTGLEEGWYYMTAEGDDRLFAVSSTIVEDMNMEYAVLHPVPKPEIYGALLDRITVADADGNVIAEWTLQGKITDRDAASNWAVTVPFTYPADEESIKNLKKSAENIHLGVYTGQVGDDMPEEYGLAQPQKVITFHMAAGSTGTVSDIGVYDVKEHEETTVTLYIGNARDDMADYVRFGDEIFTVSRFTLSVFTEPDPVGTAARYPVLVPLASLESLTVEENGGKREYVLREKEGTGEEAEGESPGREVMLDGTEISWDAFEAAYDRLLTVTFSGTLPKGAEWKEPYKKYTFRTLSGGTHTVELSDWDGIHDAVTVDGSTLFYLIKNGMTELPPVTNPAGD